MRLFYIFLTTIFIFINFSVLADKGAEDILNQFDKSFYRPQSHGLHNFKVDIRIDGLSKKLNDHLVFGKVEDIFFELSWFSQSGVKKGAPYKIEVFGMPKGFFEIKSELSNNIVTRLDFIVPKTQVEIMNGYHLSSSKGSDGNHTIICRDLENLRDASEIIMRFDAKKKLKSFVVKRPMGTEVVSLTLEKKPWSNGKWVLGGHKVKKTFGSQIIESESQVQYSIIGGIGLPNTITTNTTHTLMQPSAKKSDTYKREVSSEMKFSRWMVNNNL